MSQLWQNKERLEKLNVDVLVITFESNAIAKEYAEETKLQWPILVDEAREMYRAYGIRQGSFWGVWGPATWLAYLLQFWQGNKPRPYTGGNIYQLGGDVLIDPDGIVRMLHIASGPSDRPSMEAIFQKITHQPKS